MTTETLLDPVGCSRIPEDRRLHQRAPITIMQDKVVVSTLCGIVITEATHSWSFPTCAECKRAAELPR